MAMASGSGAATRTGAGEDFAGITAVGDTARSGTGTAVLAAKTTGVPVSVATVGASKMSALTGSPPWVVNNAAKRAGGKSMGNSTTLPLASTPNTPSPRNPPSLSNG